MRLLRSALGVVAVGVVVAATAWWLFGYRVEEFPRGGNGWAKRHFGRYTTVSYDHNDDGVPEATIYWTWNDPFTDNHDLNWNGNWTRRVVDMNGDGNWDVWVTNLCHDDDTAENWEFKADTNGDGEPNWSRRVEVDWWGTYDEIAKEMGLPVGEAG